MPVDVIPFAERVPVSVRLEQLIDPQLIEYVPALIDSEFNVLNKVVEPVTSKDERVAPPKVNNVVKLPKPACT